MLFAMKTPTMKYEQDISLAPATTLLLSVSLDMFSSKLIFRIIQYLQVKISCVQNINLLSKNFSIFKETLCCVLRDWRRGGQFYFAFRGGEYLIEIGFDKTLNSKGLARNKLICCNLKSSAITVHLDSSKLFSN